MNDRLKEAFDKVHAEEELKKSTLKFLSEKTHGYGRNRTFRNKRLIPIMASLLFMLLGAGGYFSYFTQTSAISVDVNPSIELGVNTFDKVISVEGYNEDGRELASSLNIKFLDYTDAIDKILTNEDIVHYLSQDEIVSITVVGENDEKSNEMLLGVTSSTKSNHKNVYCYAGNSEEVATAHRKGMSFGKYRAFLELQVLNPNITVEDVKGLTMRQIRNMIDELSKSQKNTTKGCDLYKGENR